MPRRDWGVTFNWDLYLNGETHVIDLVETQFQGTIADFRTLAYREAEKRWGRAATSRVGNTKVQVIGSIPGFRAPAAKLVPSPTNPQVLVSVPATTDPAPELTAEEEEELLGPCSCGKSPYCLPTCARFSG